MEKATFEDLATAVESWEAHLYSCEQVRNFIRSEVERLDKENLSIARLADDFGNPKANNHHLETKIRIAIKCKTGDAFKGLLSREITTLGRKHCNCVWGVIEQETREYNKVIELRNNLVDQHMGMVVHLANKMRGGFESVDELIQEGAIGLIRAVEKYDPQRPVKFITFATPWVKQAIGRAKKRKGSTVGVPLHVHSIVTKINELKRLMGTDSIDEIAEEISEDASELKLLLKRAYVARSLNIPVSGHNTDVHDEWLDRICDNIPSPEEEAQSNSMKRALKKAMDTLTKKERGILIMRFGLDGEESKTLAFVADKYEISRERARQLECRAIAKLRNGGNLVP